MKTKTVLYSVCLILLFACVYTTYGQVTLPRLISDGMVLQRNTEVKIWGWANENEEVSISFLNKDYKTVADSYGEWDIILNNLKPGGPYKMQIEASNSILIDDIMIGDIWVCSGQSNMELLIKDVAWIYKDDILNSENKYIRHFHVPQRYDFNTLHKDVESSGWKSANPENVLNYTAAGYFFAKELYDKYQIPIGLINSSLGGSPAEAWMSEEALKEFPVHFEEAQRFKDNELIKQIESEEREKIHEWLEMVRINDKGFQNPEKQWMDPLFDTSEWNTFNIPGYWADSDLGNLSGVVWFRKKIDISCPVEKEKSLLVLGKIFGSDSVYVNGEFVGTTGYRYPPRRYKIPAGLLREGENTIVVRVICNYGNGAFVPEKPYKLILSNDTIYLTGEWQYRIGAVMVLMPGQTFIRWKPLGLYNAMIAPLLNYRIKGVIWYQGESNTGRALEYRELFPAMINDWRYNWQQGDFPFVYVQLANYTQAHEKPTESGWALLRESQLKTLSVPNTGMAVTYDIGEWNDIHPLNKKDVGKRLALAAFKVAYGEEDIIYSGPIYQSMKIKGNKIALKFNNTGSGLFAPQAQELKHFAIAGADKKFVWANARIENDKVIVWSEDISDPVAVRYAWADNPEDANLYNKEGLPASPFRTDDW